MLKRRVLTGLIGRDIGQSRSPAMHEAEADSQGLRLIYSLFDFAELNLSEKDLPRLLDALHITGFSGVNVTHPYKQAIIPHLDQLSEGAERVGAVNTVRFEGSQRIGHNTDVSGFAAAFGQSLSGVALDAAVQLGAGGAGSATACALLDIGVRQLTIYDLNTARVDALVNRLRLHVEPDRVTVCTDLRGALGKTNGIVNATPVGMDAHPGLPIPEGCLRSDLWVAEVVYFPLETALLTAARGAGCRVMDGGGMAVAQAAGAFEIFTGFPADSTRMTQAFLAAGREQTA